MATTRAERREAADLLRRALDAVNRGDPSADGPVAAAVVRRLEGAPLALKAMDQPHVDDDLSHDGAHLTDLTMPGNWWRADNSTETPHRVDSLQDAHASH